SHASELFFVNSSGKKYSVSLKKYATNCSYGEQTAIIPLSDFFHNQNTLEISSFNMQFWYPTQYSIDITDIGVYSRVLGVNSRGKGPTKKPRPTPIITSSPIPTSIPTP